MEKARVYFCYASLILMIFSVCFCFTNANATEGSLKWHSHYFNDGDSFQNWYAAIDSQMNTIASGTRTTSAYYQSWIVAKYDSSGRLLWESDLEMSGEEPTNWYDPDCIVTDDNGNIFVAKDTYLSGETGGYFMDIYKLSSDGNVIWHKVLNDTIYHIGKLIYCENDKLLLICQSTTFNLIMLDASDEMNGEIVWSNYANHFGDYNMEKIRSAFIDDSGRITIVGYIASNYDDYYFHEGGYGWARLDANGELGYSGYMLTENCVEGGAWYYGSEIDSDGYLYLFLGCERYNSHESRNLLTKIDNNGFIEWQRSKPLVRQWNNGALSMSNDKATIAVYNADSTTSFIQYSDTGDEIFNTRTQKKFKNVEPYNFKVDENDYVYLTGSTYENRYSVIVLCKSLFSNEESTVRLTN